MKLSAVAVLLFLLISPSWADTSLGVVVSTTTRNPDPRVTRLTTITIARVNHVRDLILVTPSRARPRIGDLTLLQPTRTGDDPLSLCSAAALEIPGFLYCEPNIPIRIASQPSNDPLLPDQSYLSTIRATDAWSMTRAAREVVVAVPDTGITVDHPDLRGRLWFNPNETPDNGIDDDENGVVDDVHGANFVDGNGDITDRHGHGTHIAGVIAAVSDNQAGIAGISHNARILPVRILDERGVGTLFDVIQGIDYAAQEGAQVINASWGTSIPSRLLLESLERARNANVLVVAAAGNERRNLDVIPFYPASVQLDNVLAVGATDLDDRLASFSNFGARTVGVGAPGVGILSTWLNGGYRYLSGTSMAVPQVVGAAALLYGMRSSSNHASIRSALMVGDIVQELDGFVLSSARLNIVRALTAYLELPVLPTPEPSPEPPKASLLTNHGGVWKERALIRDRYIVEASGLANAIRVHLKTKGTSCILGRLRASGWNRKMTLRGRIPPGFSGGGAFKVAGFRIAVQFRSAGCADPRSRSCGRVVVTRMNAGRFCKAVKSLVER